VCNFALDPTFDSAWLCAVAIPVAHPGGQHGTQWLHQIISTLEALHAVLTKRTPLPVAPPFKGNGARTTDTLRQPHSYARSPMKKR